MSSFDPAVVVMFPNPLAPDIQIHVSWATRLCFSGENAFIYVAIEDFCVGLLSGSVVGQDGYKSSLRS